MRTLPMAADQPEPIRRKRMAQCDPWAAPRLAAIAAGLGLSFVAFRSPTLGLALFWHVFIPFVPFMFLIAPGLWRNICPMATLNGLPARLGWSRGRRLPRRAQRAAPAIGVGLFFAIVPLRRVVLDQSGLALAVFVLLALAMAFAAGLLYGGKGGWCSHFCPMGPVERLYGHSPLLVIRDTHCRPCVGCTRHCPDLTPTHAHLAEVYGADRSVRLVRTALAGAMPWLCIAFFTQPPLLHPSLSGILLLYGRMSLLVAIGAGICLGLAYRTGQMHQQLIRIHAIVAFNLYCLFALPLAWGHMVYLLPQLMGVVLLSSLWLWAAVQRERTFLVQRFLGRAQTRRRVSTATGAQA